MKLPGEDRKISKANCLVMLEIWRDLRKYHMQAKIDHYYISSVAPKCFTETEFARYIRERDRAENAHTEAVKKGEKSRAEALLHSTPVGGDEGSVERELAAADRARG